MRTDDLHRFCHARRRLIYPSALRTFARIALSLRLSCHGMLHLLRQVDVLHFDICHLDAPFFSLAAQDHLQLLIDLLLCCEQFVQLGLPQDAAHRRVQPPQGGVTIIPTADHGSFGSMFRKDITALALTVRLVRALPLSYTCLNGRRVICGRESTKSAEFPFSDKRRGQGITKGTNQI